MHRHGWIRTLCCSLTLMAAFTGGAVSADPLKVDLNAGARKDILTPHWQHWEWKGGTSASQTFGGVTITFQAPSGGTLTPVLYKGLIDDGATMACSGIALQQQNGGDSGAGVIEMRLSGLTPGRHSLVTYHNELRDVAPAPFDILVDGAPQVHALVPTKRAGNNYDVASAFVTFDAVAGKDVVIRFQPAAGGSQSCMINGFEIDSVDPHRKAIKPLPANDDEHVAEDAPLTWTPSPSATGHLLYLGTDADRVARATPKSPEFKGRLTKPSFPLPKLDLRATYYWRVDEEHGSGTPATQGEVWRFRPRFLAFPGAEGYGRFARGGRGGRVIEVTNLLDYDTAKGEAVIPGSYRAAVEAEGPRFIIFRVSGIIRLKKPCAITKPYCTVAGQTAPGDGICLANYSAGAFGTHDVIIRYIRFRVGDISHKAMDGAGLGSCDNCIIDHCSISWSSDEGTSSRNARNITFQRNIVSEALQHSYHYRASDRTKYETHAFAGSISGNIGSYHHNLLADCTDRNWSLAGGYSQSGQYAGYLDIRNNVVYNWTARTTDGGVMELNYVNNYYKPYPGNPAVTWLLKLDPIVTSHGTPKYYMSGNVMEGFDYLNDNWKAFKGTAEEQTLVRVDKPLFEPYVRTETAAEALKSVLADVGATLPKQDVIDRRLIEEVRTGTAHYSGTRGPTFDPPGRNYAGIIDAPTDVKDAAGSPDFPWPEYRTYNVPVDSDHDGIPDDWEKRYGLNPNDPSDANGDRNGDGFTNLEKYLYGLDPTAPPTDWLAPNPKVPAPLPAKVSTRR